MSVNGEDMYFTKKNSIADVIQWTAKSVPFETYDTPPLCWDLVKILIRKLWHTSCFLLEHTDFKNVIFEKIPLPLSEVGEVADVKQPRNPKWQKF